MQYSNDKLNQIHEFLKCFPREEDDEFFVEILSPSSDVFHDAETLLSQLEPEKLGEIEVDIDALGGLSVVVYSTIHPNAHIWFSLLNSGGRSVLVTNESGGIAWVKPLNQDTQKEAIKFLRDTDKNVG